ncbi:UDP-N-acetylglucosamine 1-carboxyvinyltransferase [Rhodospirillum rubrum]|uniref:UDP-N-acetylglucosamine 1-carboxyvinyltransferase n=1 Tax=Rhodospirillum rubrum TaxID=1085 RepID=UPI001907DBC1|nr:UDP-N-acetylglucosamine 1-carboxyvinyltransferase [Rhodospirillum rubrum]MBK1665529.1 UDP-N-acetylglucosamine 1-carboxyvinyltransferase [Rhodospirillum rubrum]MBK1677513.1 UDP-N-acetylglucosamine 1-carboxyvinyltransferase [Rhodospirillum rubrum]
MDRIRIVGGAPLDGTIRIGGAKNAALTLMPVCLLTDQPVTLTNLPDLADIRTMAALLGQMGVGTLLNGAESSAGRHIDLDASSLSDTTAPYDLVRKMRASILVLGPLVARHGRARVSLPGGCAIGTRPVDLHLKALEALGAHIELKEGYIHASVEGRLKGAKITFPKVTVGGTENALMAATLAEGETLLENVAREPEITDLALCLRAMGAKIDGIGSGTLRVEGVDTLSGTSHAVVPDRIETGTYALAAAATRGRLTLTGTRLDLVDSLVDHLRRAGVVVTAIEGGLEIDARTSALTGVDVMTEPFPGFPTDMQAQWMAVMSTARGASMITESIFENRFMHVPELSRMGADINIHGGSAIVRGVAGLSGAQVMATDLRASVCLVLAALAASGETIINRVYHLDRGYERVEEKLAACGATIERLRD